MAELKKIRRGNSGSVKVFPGTHKLMVSHCLEKGIKISYFVTEAIKDKLEKEKK